MTLVAVFDAGKTRLKLTLVGPKGEVVHSVSTTSSAVEGPLPGLDIERAEAFLVHALSDAARRFPVSAIVPVGHAAAAVWTRDGRAVAPPLDYEAAPPMHVSVPYETQRPAFGETYSPTLPLGLNLGRQLAWVEQSAPEISVAADSLVLWPQYWALRLSGQAASEVSSLGSHTDLWAPVERGWSSMAKRRGWAERFAPLAAADTVLGLTQGPLAKAAGLNADIRVLCGAHDSNAALQAARLSGQMDHGAALVSTGTWTVVLALSGQLSHLNPARDCLANVAIDGQAVPTARFMGGKEYALIAGEAPVEPTREACAALVSRGVRTVPPFAAAGPFMAACAGRIEGEPDGAAERAALATLHCALMIDYCLDLVGAHGATLIEGPLTRNLLAPGLLAAISGRPVMLCADDGVSLGAASLALGSSVADAARCTPCDPVELPGLAAYTRQWREVAEAPRAAA